MRVVLNSSAIEQKKWVTPKLLRVMAMKNHLNLKINEGAN